MSIQFEGQLTTVIFQIQNCLKLQTCSRDKFSKSPHGMCVISRTKSGGRSTATIEIENDKKICVFTSLSGVIVSAHLASGASDKELAQKLRDHFAYTIPAVGVQVLPKDQ
jgi:hypothetical protein